MKVGDNNVIESKGNSWLGAFGPAVNAVGTALTGTPPSALPGSVCRQERDPDERLHHRGLLQREHLRGDPGEHRHLRGRLPAPRADRAASGVCVGGTGTRWLPPPVPLGCALTSPALPFQPQTLQLDFLMKILPNYHHLKKTMKAASTPVKS